MKFKEILVTGGSGFIGSHLVRRLVKLGFNVTVTAKYKSIIDCPRLVPVWNDIKVVEADLRNIDSVLNINKITKKYDLIYHLAAYNHVGDSFNHIHESLLSNLISTANLLEFGPKFGRFIYTASSEVYGFQNSVPFRESDLPFPISPYAIGKYGGELYARMKKHQNANKDILCLRPFNTFGPYQSERAIIPEIILKCLKGETIKTTRGLQTREFNYIDNIIDGFIAATNVSKIPDNPINIGSGKEILIKDLVKLIHELTNSKSILNIGALEDRPTEIWRMKADNKEAKLLLGWSENISFEEGLINTINWYKRFVKVYFGKNGLSKL